MARICRLKRVRDESMHVKKDKTECIIKEISYETTTSYSAMQQNILSAHRLLLCLPCI